MYNNTLIAYCMLLNMIYRDFLDFFKKFSIARHKNGKYVALNIVI